MSNSINTSRNEIKDCVVDLYQSILKDKGYPCFYTFINESFDEFIGKLKDLDDCVYSNFFSSYSSFFSSCKSKQRFINLMKQINKDLLDVLKECYLGRQYKATKKIEQILFCKSEKSASSKYSKYLDEPYFNYLNKKLRHDDKKMYYRIRLSGKGEKIDNCWCVPYEKRYLASVGRYSVTGQPCLYLGDSLETCLAEILQDDFCCSKYDIWYSKFIIKPHNTIGLCDLHIPDKSEIEDMDEYDLLSKLVTYPLVLLCSTKARHPKGFNEEYFIPQLLCQTLLRDDIDSMEGIKLDGIMYSSTKNPAGYNIVLPAKYKKKNPLDSDIPDKGISPVLDDIFEAKDPEKLNLCSTLFVIKSFKFRPFEWIRKLVIKKL